jgi:hypothetical protein
VAWTPKFSPTSIEFRDATRINTSHSTDAVVVSTVGSGFERKGWPLFLRARPRQNITVSG